MNSTIPPDRRLAVQLANLSAKVHDAEALAAIPATLAALDAATAKAAISALSFVQANASRQASRRPRGR